VVQPAHPFERGAISKGKWFRSRIAPAEPDFRFTRVAIEKVVVST
jgi:hypothetical protein